MTGRPTRVGADGASKVGHAHHEREERRLRPLRAERGGQHELRQAAELRNDRRDDLTCSTTTQRHQSVVKWPPQRREASVCSANGRGSARKGSVSFSIRLQPGGVSTLERRVTPLERSPPRSLYALVSTPNAANQPIERRTGAGCGPWLWPSTDTTALTHWRIRRLGPRCPPGR